MKKASPVIVYILMVAFFWYQYAIEKDCFSRGGKLGLAIMYTTPIVMAIFCELANSLVARLQRGKT